MSRISWIFVSNFYKSVFSIFTIIEYRKLGFQKSEIFKHLSKTGISKIWDFQHPCFRYSPIVNIENMDAWKSQISNIYLVNVENWDLKKSEVFKHPCFRYSPIVNIENTDVWKSRNFLKSKFSIFTIGEYRKHGFIKVGEKNLWYPRYPRNLRFRPGRQLPFIPSYFLCYGKQVTIVTEGYFYISAVWRCKRPRFGIEVTVDLTSNFCVWLLG